MDVREKLVELCEYLEILPCCATYEEQAEYLISHGVTVQKWISVDARLPEECGLYFTFGCTAVPVRLLHNFDKDMGKFGVWWDYDTDGKKHPRYRFIEAEDITHWMPLPNPPKGE